VLLITIVIIHITIAKMIKRFENFFKNSLFVTMYNSVLSCIGGGIYFLGPTVMIVGSSQV
jgi:hypothetical protein